MCSQRVVFNSVKAGNDGLKLEVSKLKLNPEIEETGRDSMSKYN